MVPTNGPTVAAIRAHCMPSRKSVGSRALPPLLPLPLTKEEGKKKAHQQQQQQQLKEGRT